MSKNEQFYSDKQQTVNLLKKRNKRARNKKEHKIPASYKLNRHQFTNDCLYDSYLHRGKVYNWLLRKEYCKAFKDRRRLLMQWVGCCILVNRQVAELYNNCSTVKRSPEKPHL